MHIANTVRAIDLGTNPLVAKIMDREVPLTKAFVQQVMGLTQFTWHGRRPKPAMTKNGSSRKTNLDLLSWMVELSNRQAHIVLDRYDNQLSWKACANERHVGGTKRFGSIIGLISHRDHLSFSVKIKDQSVLRTAQGTTAVGAERTYQIADYQGSWSPGWHGFDWEKSADELDYLKRRRLLDGDGNMASFEDYVHHNRRQSVYGAPYLLLKLLWQRIEDEIRFYESELKRLDQAGIATPQDLLAVGRHWLAVGESRGVEVPVFHMEVSGPRFRNEYSSVSNDPLGYRLALLSLQFLKNQLRPTVQFVVRADEVAFYRFGLEQRFVASWIKGTWWSHNSRSGWSAMKLGEDLTLRYKRSVTEKRVAA